MLMRNALLVPVVALAMGAAAWAAVHPPVPITPATGPAATPGLAAAGAASTATRGGTRPFAGGRGGRGGAGMRFDAPGTVRVEPRVHDPVIAKEADTYYIFWTGRGINRLKSKDLIHWEVMAPAFEQVPQWVTDQIGARGLWAPDISYFGGKYHLYYCGSQFGKNRSAIGQATSSTLDPASKDYRWVDQGKVFESQPSDPYNAIDPNVVFDDKGGPWLNFGSFWTGIKLRKLTTEGMADPADPKIYDLASRPEGTHAIEAPFIVHRDGFYYLFVSFDFCCRGVDSTYRVMVGRSAAITGPYADKAGKPMLEGGGTEILATDGKRVIGPGHCGLLEDGPGKWLMVHHFYDGDDRGASKLQVRLVSWDAQGWPVVGEAINKEAAGR